MGQHLITVRVRPPRGVVLVDEASPLVDLVKLVRFLSQMWGGKYYPILPVSHDEPDDLTLFRLEHNRPDYVFGVGIAHDTWTPRIHQACQPRRYRPLSDEDIGRDVGDLIRLQMCHSDRAVISLFESRLKPSAISRPVKVIETNSEEWQPYLSAMYGVPVANLNDKYRDEHQVIEALDAKEFIRLHQDFVEGRKLSWLDAGRYGLTPLLSDCSQVDPTIVIVGDSIIDLCQFWNLRTTAGNTASSWIIPIPVESVHSPEVQEALVEWLGVCSEHSTPDFCTITTTTVSDDVSNALAKDLSGRLKGTEIKYVDVLPPGNRIPRVIPFERELTWPVEIDGRRLTIVPPSLGTFRPEQQREHWLVDLLRDNSTGRAVGEMYLPCSPVVPEVINSPCPPQVGMSSPRRFGCGYDAVNLLCSANQKPLSLCIPSSEEVLEEHLRECGLEVLKDEKRSGYLPVIDRFGGLYQASKAMSGDRGRLLKTLHSGRVRSPQEMATLDTAKQNSQLGPEGFILLATEARGRAGLTNSNLDEEHGIERVRRYMKNESERVQRVSVERTREYLNKKNPTEPTVQALLEHWANSKVVQRKWNIGPCRECGRKRVYVDQVDLSQLPSCPHCGGMITVRGGFEVGYTLEPSIRNAMTEGILTVVLTGQFLRNLSDHGFFWLPGVKYKMDNVAGDIDVLACCDGILVFGECKGLAETPHDAETWNSVVVQFLQTAEVANQCHGHLAILAAMVEEFPPDVRTRIEQELNGKIPFLLLGRNELEAGMFMNGGENEPPVTLESLLPVQFQERQHNFVGTRTIRSGGMLYTKKGRQ